MSQQRVLVLCHDIQKTGSLIQNPSLSDVQVSIFQDWESSAAALCKEHFSVIIAQIIVPNDSAAMFVSRIQSLASKTPLVLVLPENDGRSILDALKSGASEILFEETFGDLLVATIQKYLRSKGCMLHGMSVDGLFDFCIPVITTTDTNLLAEIILGKLREALGDSFGVFFKEDGGNNDPYSIYSAVGFADDEEAMSFLRYLGKPIIRHAVSSSTVISMEKLKEELPENGGDFDAPRFLLILRFDLESGTKMYVVFGLNDELDAGVTNNLIFLCRQAYLALINSERSAQVQSLIYIDDLTKLHNFRYLNVVIDREIKRSERYHNLFSVLFMDIDYFKRVNDTHGHLVGSRVLQEVGAVLKSCVRDSDTVIRYGGDEFVVLLVDTNSEEALFVAERMRKAVEKEPLAQSMGIDVRLTVSIGVASFPEHATTKQHLLNLADRAMYRGKESTRNVVYMAQPQKFS
ncbi:MAG: GGDEF domain-containing protein [Syntrophorhabdaceae bacterium]|nr:GGDEF domain-containing protein [Syntrophorhabdaceae bacterium]